MARRTKSPAQTVIEQCLQDNGYRKTIWALQFFGCYVLAVRDAGWQAIDEEQYARYWKKSKSQGYRDTQRWREMFPDGPSLNERALAFKAVYDQLTAELGSDPKLPDISGRFAALPAA